MSDRLTELKNFGPIREENFEEFEALLEETSQGRNRNVIVPLLSTLDDGCELDEVMFSVVHCLEDFPRESYMEELAANLSVLLQKSPRWITILHTRIMNSPPDFESYLNVVSASAESRAAFVRILKGLLGSPRFDEKAQDAIRRLAVD